MDGKYVGERYFEWLRSSRQSGQEVAARTGISPTTLSNLLNNKIEHPRLSTVRGLASHFGVSVEDFLSGPEAWKDRRQSNWKDAERNARNFRRWAEKAIQEELSGWAVDKDRARLEEVGRILQEGYDVVTDLWRSLGGQLHEAAEWKEIQAADRFYRQLVQTVLDNGLVVIQGKEGSARPEKVEELAIH
jgi:transcriptional regulator with XRE-family HTH domain